MCDVRCHGCRRWIGYADHNCGDWGPVVTKTLVVVTDMINDFGACTQQIIITTNNP
jgi:hypothetical protein